MVTTHITSNKLNIPHNDKTLNINILSVHGRSETTNL